MTDSLLHPIQTRRLPYEDRMVHASTKANMPDSRGHVTRQTVGACAALAGDAGL